MTRCHSVRFAHVLMLLAAVIMLTGCIKIDSTIEIDADGAGSWRVVYAMPMHMIRQIEMTSGMVRELDRAGKGLKPGAMEKVNDLPYLFDEAAVRARFKALESQGVLLGKLVTRSQGGWRYVDLTVKFTRLETLLRQSFFDWCGFTLSGAGTGSYKLIMTLPDMGVPSELPSMDDPTISERVSPFMNGLRVTSRIGVPGDIRNSNSAGSDARRATWEWDYDKDSRALTRLAQEKMILVFDGAGVRLRDFTKPAMRE